MLKEKKMSIEKRLKICTRSGFRVIWMRVITPNQRIGVIMLSTDSLESSPVRTKLQYCSKSYTEKIRQSQGVFFHCNFI